MTSLKINGVEVTVPEGTTILIAARDNGISIPTLCFLDGLTSYGGCRLCLVEIAGSPKLFPACATPVSSGMEVITNSERLKEYRKMAVQMLLAERTHVCSVCVADDHCELQELASQLGVDHVTLERNWTGMEIDSSHDFLVIDRNRCILCTRCIRICDEIEGVHTLDLKLRGKDAQIIMDLDDHWANSCSCTSCRKCAKVCPVGAIYIEGEPISYTKRKHIAEFILGRRKR
ncbi:TPA: 2Fe-2S iron-sulfur cluster binding domain-containing protein [Candidatus Bathyarchaeota archaeon]|nr:2Fe-2S iron-sulfur cluster binding domain-containing protein [Candidatus Bathyarchaeota archaeon]HIJ08481.1 2Fe-2S iron-sulfur cluster binding domain-containing protein [Candidatus Bathyarchaeota archaeon]